MKLTKETARRLLNILNGFVEGKTIQHWVDDKHYYEDYIQDKDETIDILDNIRNIFDNEFTLRIKPEKYVPFDNLNECIEEMDKHKPFGLLRNQFGDYYQILKYDDCGLILIENSEKLECVTWKTAFKMYHYADETPFGKKI